MAASNYSFRVRQIPPICTLMMESKAGACLLVHGDQAIKRRQRGEIL
jgi:hypothetical protein